METEPEQMKQPFEPRISIRLACWFGIYSTVCYFYSSGIALHVLPGEQSANIYWLSAQRIPADLQLLIVGFLHLNPEGIFSQGAWLLAYGCYLLDLALCCIFVGKKSFWILIFLLVVLIFLSLMGSSLYVSTTFKTI